MTNLQATKLCPHCDEIKGIKAFSNCARNSSGLQCWCKSCYSKWAKEHPHPVTVTEKLCRHCGFSKPAAEFALDTAKKDGLRSVCRVHDSKLRRERRDPVLEAAKDLKHRERNRPKAMLKGLRQGAKKRGIRCVLVEADLAAVPVPDICPVLSIPMFWTQGKRTGNAPSIDRINPNGIYEKGNWRYISWMANRLKKSDCNAPEIFEAIAADLRRLGFGRSPAQYPDR